MIDRHELLFAGAFLLALMLIGCASDRTLSEGAPVAPPLGVESLCANNPETCDD